MDPKDIMKKAIEAAAAEIPSEEITATEMMENLAHAARANNWQPIETAPRRDQIVVWGYRIQGQTSPGGPYRYYYRTIGEVGDCGCRDLLKPEDRFGGPMIEHPLMWHRLPAPPPQS